MPALSDVNGLASYCHLTWFGSYERFLRPVMADVMVERDAFGLAEDLGPYFELFVSSSAQGFWPFIVSGQAAIPSFPWKSLPH